MENPEINKLAYEIQTELRDTKAYNKKKMEILWKEFEPIVNKLAYRKSIKTGGQHKNDLIQVCYIALCSAINKYQKDKIDFKNYAIMWFVAHIKLENLKNISIFKYSTRKDRKLFGKISQVSELPIAEQAIILGVSLEDLSAFLLSTKVTKSLLKKRQDSSDDEESEEYISCDYPQPDFLYDFKVIYETSKKVFDEFAESLSCEREKAVLELLRRVGPPEKGNFKEQKNEENIPQNYQDLADMFGVSRERIRQISKCLTEKLKRKLEKNGVTSNAYHAFI